jgi:hypothetical protein
MKLPKNNNNHMFRFLRYLMNKKYNMMKQEENDK